MNQSFSLKSSFQDDHNVIERFAKVHLLKVSIHPQQIRARAETIQEFWNEEDFFQETYAIQFLKLRQKFQQKQQVFAQIKDL